MNKYKTVLPVFTLIAGLIGLFLFPNIVIFDGGLFSDMQFPESEYKNSLGEELYTYDQLFEYTGETIKVRATFWALDVLSVYMVVHGVLACAYYRKNLATPFKSLVLTILFSIPGGVVFWVILWKIIWKLGMPHN